MKNTIKVCPKCGSTNLAIPPAKIAMGKKQRDICRDCNNMGHFPEKVVTEVASFQRKMRRK